MSEATPDTLGSTTPPESVRPEKVPHPIGVHLTAFITRIDSLADTFPLTMLAIRRAKKDTNKRFDEFLATRCVRSTGEEDVFIIPPDHFPEFTRIHEQCERDDDLRSIATRIA
jgi:hypothetical protein